MNVVCKLCNQETNDHAHWWKTHKIKEANYFLQYHPRKNLLTNRLLAFKNVESYLLQDFDNKLELREYLKKTPKDKALEYLKYWLMKRKSQKNLEYSHGQAELKSLLFPAVSYIEKTYGSGTYNKLCESIGLKNRFDYGAVLTFNDKKELNFLVDTRENKPLDLPNIQVVTLNYGDYCVIPEQNENKIFIERKSLNDIISSLSSNFDRFCREIERAANEDAYIVVLIEDSYRNFSSLEYLVQTRWTKASSVFILSRMRELLRFFPLNSQIVFTNNRKNSVNLIQKIYQANSDIRKVDIEFLLDNKMLNLE